jgi:hypothetical protein
LKLGNSYITKSSNLIQRLLPGAELELDIISETINNIKELEVAHSKRDEVSAILKAEVEETFGHPISSSRDCILLSEEIYFKTSFKVNSNTLRRFFKLVKADYPPSAATLNILAKYCGFESIDEFITIRKNRKSKDLTESKGILDYMISIFKSTNVKSLNDEIYLALVKHTIQFLHNYPEYIDKFQRAVAKTKNGQEYYFEQFVHIDSLNSFYGEGLRYYLNEKRTTEAHIFVYSLFCFRAWLSDNKADLKKYFKELTRHRPNKSIHPFVCGRYFAAHLFFAEMTGLNTERILIEAQHVHATLSPDNDNYKLFPCFEYVFSAALMLTGHYQEALYYTNFARRNYPGKHAYMDQGYYKTMQITRAIALVKTGEKEESEKIFEQLRPSQFYFMTKKLNTILYLLLRKYLNKPTTKVNEQIDRLIEETGFVRLKSFL